MLKNRLPEQLPSVEVVGDPYYDVLNVAEVLTKVINFELPGLGTKHKAPLGKSTTHEENHRWDMSVLIRALALIVPQNALHLPPAPTAPGISVGFKISLPEGTKGHYDVDERPVTENGLVMTIRGHTASNEHGAHWILNNAYPGRSGFGAGDTNIFTPGQDSAEARHRGYVVIRRVRSEELVEETMHGLWDPNLAEEAVYEFDQEPGNSVFFRTNSSFGSLSGHAVEPVNPYEPRDIMTSDVQIFSYPQVELDAYGEPDIIQVMRYWDRVAAVFRQD